jgi:SAM-dependent methyltransferase
VQIMQDYDEALRVLTPSIVHRQFLGLLRGAFISGLFSIARTPQTVPHFAAALNMDEERAIALFLALEAHGVLIRDGDYYQMDEHWATLSAPDTPIDFQALLDAADAAAQAIEHGVLGGDDYWTMPRDIRLALARGSTFDPTSPHPPVILEALLRNYVPEVHARLSAGGRYLELGCGIGGTLLSLLRAYPLMTAVGVELAGDVLSEARRQATTLGVSHRVVFYQGDARDFSEFAAFDVALWSHSFFPKPSRALTLQVVRYALKRGGFLLVPLLNDRPSEPEKTYADAGRQFLLQRVLYGGWGIPVLDAPEIQQEIEAAGFSATRMAATPLQRIVVARCQPSE